MELHASQIEEIIGIKNDIAFVRINSTPGIAQDNLRICSAAMRKIVEGFGNCWKRLKLEPKQPIIKSRKIVPNEGTTFIYVSLADDGVIEEKYFRQPNLAFGPSKIEFCNPQGEWENMPMRGGGVEVVHYTSDSVHNFNKEHHEMHDDVIKNYNFPLSEFWQSCVIYTNNRKISRERIVRYIADTRGGTHFDRGGNKTKKKDDYRELDIISDGVPIQGRDPVFFAFMSICQDFTNSPDVQKFEEIASGIRPLISRR